MCQLCALGWLEYIWGGMGTLTAWREIFNYSGISGSRLNNGHEREQFKEHGVGFNLEEDVRLSISTFM